MFLEALIITVLYFIAIVALAAVAGIVDQYLDPHCHCADNARTRNEAKGVRL